MIKFQPVFLQQCWNWFSWRNTRNFSLTTDFVQEGWVQRKTQRNWKWEDYVISSKLNRFYKPVQKNILWNIIQICTKFSCVCVVVKDRFSIRCNLTILFLKVTFLTRTLSHKDVFYVETFCKMFWQMSHDNVKTQYTILPRKQKNSDAVVTIIIKVCFG